MSTHHDNSATTTHGAFFPHRIQLVKNKHYVKSGKKSYGHAMRKFNMKPTLAAPFDMVDAATTHSEPASHQALQDRVRGKPSTTAHRTMVVSHADGTTGEVSAQDVQNDSEYLAPVSIGTPAQTLNLDFDTGSSDLWVWSTELSMKVQAQGKMTSHTIFNESKSSSFKSISGDTWKIAYGDGSSASGYVGTDVVNIGGISIQAQAVEVASKISSEFRSSAGDGLLGLAFDTLNTVRPTAVKTPVDNMIAQGDIPSNAQLFTAYLGSVKDVNDPDQGKSFYTFGFIDQATVTATGSSISYAPVDNSNGFWKVASSGYIVGSQTYSTNGGTASSPRFRAIIDTGTTLALVDDTTVKNIYAQIPGSKYDSTQGGYTFPTATSTSSLPVVKFDIGGTYFTVNAEDLAFADVGNGYTYGGIQSRGDLPFNIYGDTFLKSIYAVFDMGNMRFGAVQRTEPSSSTSTSHKTTTTTTTTTTPAAAKS